MPEKRALVIDDGATAAALAGCRALAADGWTVGLGAPDRSTLTRSSRAVKGFHRVRSPETDLESFLQDVNSAIASGGYQIVFGSSDAHVLALSAHRDRLAALVPYAEHEVVLRSFDKLDIVRAAERAGLAVPRTEPATPEALATFSFPAVVKSRLQWAPGEGDESASLHTAVVNDAQHAEAVIAAMRKGGGEPVLQECIFGGLMAFSVVVDRDGMVRARLQQRSPRIFPVEVGSSARAVTTPIDASLAGGIDRLMADIGWFGMVQLQFLDPGGGDEPRLIDLNGRFYGSMPLAGAAGCNLAGVWAALAMGGSPSSVEARAGARFQSLDSDVRRAFEERRGGLLADVGGTIAFAPGAVHSTWNTKDPVPALRLFIRSVGRAIRKVIRLWSPSSSTA
jgi:predicted ATP-grasp superfamily ATP-dependent carboligase